MFVKAPFGYCWTTVLSSAAVKIHPDRGDRSVAAESTDEGNVTGDGYVARIRQKVGHDLLLLPSAAVLPRDDAGRVLLVRHSYTGVWGLVGGAVEVGESPAEAAVREAREEIGVEVELGKIVCAVGGPDYELEYPNGDRCAFVAIAFEAKLRGEEIVADGVETTDVGWFSPAELPEIELNGFARALLKEVGLLER